MQSWRYFDCAMGHDAQIAKASWQWNQTSNPCSLQVKAVITNLVRCFGSQQVHITSSKHHLNPFSHASVTEIGVTYTILLGQAKSVWLFSFVQFWLPSLFNSFPFGNFFSLYVTIYLSSAILENRFQKTSITMPMQHPALLGRFLVPFL